MKVARPEGFEPPTPRFVVCFSRFRPAYALYDQVLFWSILWGFVFYRGLFSSPRFNPLCLRAAYAALDGPGVARKPGSPGVSDAKIDKTVRGERQADGQRSGCLG